MAIMRRPRIVLGCVLVATYAGVAGAQIVGTPSRVSFVNCGGFTLTGGTAAFHVALDDEPRSQPAEATLQIYDASGAVVAEKVATLQAGQSTTLRISSESGRTVVLRAHAEVREEDLPLVSPRRAVVASLERNDLGLVVPYVCKDGGVRGSIG